MITVKRITRRRDYCQAVYNGLDVSPMYGRAVSSSSRLQTTAALDGGTCVMSANNAVKEALWFRKLGGDLKLDLGTVQIYCDKQGAIRLSKVFDRFEASKAH